MEEFDFNHPDFLKHSPQTQLFLLGCYHQGVLEEEFIEGWKECHQHVRGRRRAHYTPSGCKRVYRKLANKFDYFRKD